MKLKFEIFRFNPEVDTESRMQAFEVEAAPTDRVIDVLVSLKRTVDETLVFRKSCSHGVCGSDAMIIKGTNADFKKGKEALACKVLIKNLVEKDGDTVTLNPLKHFPVQRDLAVHTTAFYEKFEKIKPYFNKKEGLEPYEKGREFLQTVKDRELFDDATKCIMCGACYSACPILDTNPDFLGPTALIQAIRFIGDSREQGLAPRLDALDRVHDGIWACDNKFECTKVCPRGIKITKLINMTKAKIKKLKESA